MGENGRCPECGARLAPGASPGGVCPRCLLKLGFPDSDESTARTSLPAAGASDHIGPYRILEKIGEGGMGEVYRARQEAPIRREVALKLIKAGMDTKRVVARFESERQALALMSHPNIARVFEAGATEQGRPYFVMEYLQGVSITEYCDKHRLTTNERLGLFMQVCAGVQHAHQKGVIHRDIKPSNVLVGFEDEKPVPKIIDFGVARATEQRLTEKSVFTQMGALIGTPEYMSPEQAELTSLDIDTRTDVYSLGVLLYELLVGALPFEREELRRAAFDEICRKIREEEPSKPSSRVSTLGGASAESARRRKTDPSSLTRELRGDLDWITMKALEKDRTRRYASPGEFAADIRRHLQYEPVEAGRPGAGYRAKRFIRRHRVGVGFAALLVTVLAGSTALLALQAARIARERDRANEEATTAEQVSEFLVGLFEVSDPGEARGKTITAREVLETGAEKIERELADQPRIRSRLQRTIGLVYRNLGLYEEAEPLLQQSLRRQQELSGDSHPATLNTMRELAWLYVLRGRYEEAESLNLAALEASRRGLGERHPGTLAAMNNLANVYRHLRRYDEAEALFLEALEAERRILGEDDFRTRGTAVNLAVLYKKMGRNKEAESLLITALEADRRLLGEDHPCTLVTKGALADLCLQQGRYEEAERSYLEVLEASRRVLGEDHLETLLALHGLARLRSLQGERKAALELLREAVEAGYPNRGRPGSVLKTWSEFDGDPEYESIVAGLRKQVAAERGSPADTSSSEDRVAFSWQWSAEGGQQGAAFGISVASAGDVNADGFDDVVVGAHLHDNGEQDEGAAYVYLGSPAGPGNAPVWSAEGDQDGAYFGSRVGPAGDVNGDGFADVVVGAGRYDGGQENEGRIYVFLGTASGVATAPHWTAEGDQAEAKFGSPVGSAGDVNGDGYDDLIVAARLYDGPELNEGRAYVYHGSATGLSDGPDWTFDTDQPQAQLIGIGAAGDVNGDGFDDVVVGSRMYDNGERDEGRAWVFLGSDSGLSSSAAATLEINVPGAGFGQAVAGAGDVDGDGHDDIVVGAYLYAGPEQGEGAAFVYMGSPSGVTETPAWSFESDQAGAGLGKSVAAAGDVNGDGYDDLVVSAPAYATGGTEVGRVWVFFGAASGLSPAPAWSDVGWQTEGQFGWSVAAAGDVNGDGHGDIIVGAYRHDGDRAGEGRAYVYYGPALTSEGAQ